MGKKPVKIDWAEVESYLEKQSSGQQIAALIGIDNMTLYSRCKKDNGMDWQEYKQIHSSRGIEKLRHNMYQMAMVDKIPSVAIFLSKNLLGYSDKVEQKITVQEWSVDFDQESNEENNDMNED